MDSIVQQLQGLPQLTSTDPLCWLGLEQWAPQWNPHCSWARSPCWAIPETSSSTPRTPTEAEQGSARSGNESAAVPVHAVPAGHAGQTPQQGGSTEIKPSATPAVSDGRGDCAVTQGIGDDDPVYSIEQQSGGVQKVLMSFAWSNPVGTDCITAGITYTTTHTG